MRVLGLSTTMVKQRGTLVALSKPKDILMIENQGELILLSGLPELS